MFHRHLLHKRHQFHLKKEITLLDATLYGLGVIIGAGIYSLIGVGAGIAGNALWASFLIGAVTAALSALSYAELSSMYPKEAAEYVYTRHAFNKKYLSFAVEWLMFLTMVISATTVALGFAGYFSSIIGGEIPVIAAALIVALSALNYSGIKHSAWFNDVSAILSVIGLLFVGIMGLLYFSINGTSVDFFATKNGLQGILGATTVIFFAFVGFESLANLSEETKNARKVIPKAVLLSLGIAAVLYLIVSIVAVGLIGADALGTSKAPLADAMGKVTPRAHILLVIIALFATANTVLVVLIVGSRLLYGLSCNHTLPSACGIINKHGTPTVAVLIVAFLAITGLFIGNIERVALLTNIGVFIIYFTVNLSLLVLRYKVPDSMRLYKAPLNIGRFSVTAFLGIIATIVPLSFFDSATIIYELLLIISGVVVYAVFWHRR